MADRERPPRRLQTATDREAESGKARRERFDYERASSPPVDFDSITGVLHGEALRTARAGRSAEERLERGEDKADEHGERLSKLEGVVTEYGGRIARVELGHVETGGRLRVVESGMAEIGGQLKILPTLVDTMNKSIDVLQKERHLVLTTQLDVGKQHAVQELELGKEQAMEVIDKRRAEHKDELAERRAKRKRKALIVAAVLGLFGSGGLIGWLLERIF